MSSSFIVVNSPNYSHSSSVVITADSHEQANKNSKGKSPVELQVQKDQSDSGECQCSPHHHICNCGHTSGLSRIVIVWSSSTVHLACIAAFVIQLIKSNRFFGMFSADFCLFVYTLLSCQYL